MMFFVEQKLSKYRLIMRRCWCTGHSCSAHTFSSQGPMASGPAALTGEVSPTLSLPGWTGYEIQPSEWGTWQNLQWLFVERWGMCGGGWTSSECQWVVEWGHGRGDIPPLCPDEVCCWRVWYRSRSQSEDGEIVLIAQPSSARSLSACFLYTD